MCDTDAFLFIHAHTHKDTYASIAILAETVWLNLSTCPPWFCRQSSSAMTGEGAQFLVIRNTFLDVIRAAIPSSSRRRCVSEGSTPRVLSDQSAGGGSTPRASSNKTVSFAESCVSSGGSSMPRPSKAFAPRRGRRGSGRSKPVPQCVHRSCAYACSQAMPP